MRDFLITYFNDCTVSAVTPIKSTEEQFAAEIFAKGVKSITLYDDSSGDPIEIMSLERTEHKPLLYRVFWDVYITKRDYGKTKLKTYQREVFIYAENETEAINHFQKLNNGNCLYNKNVSAENIKAEKADKPEIYTPCFTAI